MSLPARRGLNIFSSDLMDGIPDRRQSVLVVTTATLVISTIFIAARLVSRLVIVRKITWDDYFIVFGWVSVSLIDIRPNEGRRSDLCFKLYAKIRHASALLPD
jgi:hypothetical protein